MSRIDKVTPFIKQCFVTAAVGSNIISGGSSLGLIAILLPQLREPGSGFRLTREEESWIASMNAPFILIGSFICTIVMDKFGRRSAHFILSVTFIVGWFVTVLASNVKILIAARAIAGVSSGQVLNLRSVLIGEYTSPKNRGAFLTTISLAQSFGIFLVHLLGCFFSWQVTALICSFFPFTSLLLIIYTPESPCWLAGKGRYDECRKVFRWLRGDEEEKELVELINAQLEQSKENFKNGQTNRDFLRPALKTIVKKEFYKPIIITFHANVVTQFSGGALMTTYTTTILSLIMGPSANVYFWMVFLDALRLLTNVTAIYGIKRFRRRTMLFSNGAVCVVAQLAISAYVYGKIKTWIPLEGVWLPALLVIVQIFTVGMALVPMPNIIAGEIFPLQYRGIGSTITMASSITAIFSIVKTFPGLVDAMGFHSTYLLYSIVITYSLLVLWVLLPETKGKTLQEIEDELRGKLKYYETEVRQPLQSSQGVLGSRRNIAGDT